MATNLEKLIALANPSRFPRWRDKILNSIIITVAIVLAPLKSRSGAPLGQSFTTLYRRLMPRDMLVVFNGALFQARENEYDIHFLNPARDPEVANILHPDEGDIVVDIGAHVGAHAIPSAKAVGESGCVVAFEPVEGNYHALQRNVKLNGVSSIVKTYNAAAYGTTKEMKLVGWDLKDPDEVSPGEGETVQVLRADEVLQDLGYSAVDYIKIDVGKEQEWEALQGLSQTLRQSPDVTVVVEVENTHEQKVNDYMRELGFTAQPISDIGHQKDILYTKS